MTPGESRVGYYATLVAATFLMGSSFIAGKLLLSAGIPALWLVGWRFLVAAGATAPLAWAEAHRGRAGTPLARLGARSLAVVALIGLTQTGAVMALLFLSMREVSAATAAILLFTNPIWVALLGRIFLHERLHAVRLLGLAFGVVGVALAIGVGPGAAADVGHVRGVLLGLGSAVCWAAATVINKRSSLPVGNWTLSFYQMLIGALALLALTYVLGEHPAHALGTREWLWFAWLSIPASTGSFGLWFLALRQGGATTSSGYLFLAPVFTVLLSYAILRTPITLEQTLGVVSVGLAIRLVNRGAGRQPARPGTGRA